MKFIAIDYGTKKIGIAMSDGLGSMAFAKEVIHYSSNSLAVERITLLCKEHGITAVVFGIPLYKDGTISPVASKVHAFITLLQKIFPVPYYAVNEYLTSFEASSAVFTQKREEYTKGKKNTVLDAYSAKIILDDFLAIPHNKREECLFIGEKE